VELFSTDRDRLAFLLEMDVALDLDLEALEAQAGAAAEEPSPEKRPNYVTNRIGSKHKLVDWIEKHTRERVESLADAGGNARAPEVISLTHMGTLSQVQAMHVDRFTAILNI